MTEAEHNLIEGAVEWRRLQLCGPVTRDTSLAMARVAAWAEEVIRERNATERPESTLDKHVS